MKNRKNNVLPFPKAPEEFGTSPCPAYWSVCWLGGYLVMLVNGAAIG